ncbi:MAG: hypothetical protein ABS69_19835 [Nitrosomonadales bacterium SCN 54-20]|nr:MAG: hypothetical protein ABS69_19835 [Nitrosomonadales bacterium SCN 54-20]
MAEIILPGRFRAQPQDAVRVDPAWRLRGLVLVPLTQASPRNLVTDTNFVPGALATAPALVAKAHGRALYFNGSTARLQSATPLTPRTQFTVFAWCRPTAFTTYGSVAQTSSQTGFFLGQNNSNKWCFAVNNAAPESCVGGTPSIGSRDFICGVFDGTNSILYVNGVQVASAPATAPSASLLLYVGANGNGGGVPNYAFNGDIDMIGVYNRLFSPSEIYDLYQNPWQLFRAPARKLWPGDTGLGLGGVVAIQVNSGSAVEITQHHALAVPGLTQAGGTPAGKIEQNQVLVATAPVQSNLGSTAGITRGVALAGAVIAPDRTLSAGEVSQAHMLGVGALAQGKALPGEAITQAHILAEADLAQLNAGGILSISIGSGTLVGKSSTQANASGTGGVTQTHSLVATFCSQINKASAKAISDGVVIESALINKPVEAIHIKKPGIPVGTPPWLKIMLEILTGRRGNRITLPAFRTLTFSAPPTQAECEALYAYINSVRDSLEQLISRMDG